MKYKTNINFTSFFKDDETFTNHLKQLETENFDIEEFKKKSLKDQLDWYFAKYLEWEKFYSYNEVNSDLDLENQNYNQNKDIINKIKTKLDELKKVINREILNIDIPLDEYLENVKDYNGTKGLIMEVHDKDVNLLKSIADNIVNQTGECFVFFANIKENGSINLFSLSLTKPMTSVVYSS